MLSPISLGQAQFVCQQTFPCICPPCRRNNFPTESKLAPKLLGLPDSCAYCCQCSWRSVTRDVVVDFGGDLRWVCAGHSSGE